MARHGIGILIAKENKTLPSYKYFGKQNWCDLNF